MLTNSCLILPAEEKLLCRRVCWADGRRTKAVSVLMPWVRHPLVLLKALVWSQLKKNHDILVWFYSILHFNPIARTNFGLVFVSANRRYVETSHFFMFHFQSHVLCLWSGKAEGQKTFQVRIWKRGLSFGSPAPVQGGIMGLMGLQAEMDRS